LKTFNVIKVIHTGRSDFLPVCLSVCVCMYRSRYTELLNPLIINAQHKLIKRITEHGGTAAPQPHYARALNDGLAVSAPADYLQLQLRVGKVSDQPPTASTDTPQTSTAYSSTSWYTCT